MMKSFAGHSRARFSMLMLFFILSSDLAAQSHTEDSLLFLEKLEIGRTLLFQDTDSARKIGMEVYERSLHTNYQWGLSQAYIFIAASYHRQAQFDTAIYLCQKTIDLFAQLQDSVHAGSAYLTQGMCFVSTGDYERGAEVILNSLRIFENLSREVQRRRYLPRVYNMLGQVYYYQGDFETTRQHFLTYLELATEFQDTLLIGSANTNLGAVYYELGDYEKSLSHDLKAAEIQKSLGNQLGYANAIQNIASGWMELGDHTQAEKFFKTAMGLYAEIPNIKGTTETYFNLGRLYRQMKRYQMAEESYRKAIELSKEAENPDVIRRALSGLSRLEEDRGNYQSALDYYRRYHDLSDSLVNESNRNKISELQVAFDTEKKEQEIEILNTRNSLQAAVIERNNLYILAAALLIAAIVIMSILMLRQRSLRADTQLEQEKSKLKSEQIRAVIDSQEKERKRFAMDLHDDFGQLISALKLNVSKLRNSGPSQIAEKSEEILDSMYSSLKNIAFDLMPHTLFEKGLEEAVEGLCDQVNTSGEVKMATQSFELKDLIDNDQKVAVYRIIQELVSNCLKYSKATRINIGMTNLGESLSLVIEDDGDGFDLLHFKNGVGNGWKNIRSRLDLLGGEIVFDTVPGRKNTTVSLEIPYSHEREAAVA